MILTPTVFVLGAGASVPYGLPLGVGLKQLVLENYTPADGHNANLLFNVTEFSPEFVGEFVQSLRYSGLSSVDAFLERRAEFMDVGKAMMGIELFQREASADPWRSIESWLAYLYGHMVGIQLEDFATNQVTFVTFNYDRIVEHFLYTSLIHSFGRSAEDTAAVASEIPVIHLHGRLGSLPWQQASDSIPFGATTIDAATMNVFRRDIKVVHEDTADGRDAEFSRAKGLLAKAQRVYLLGFGFGVRNVQRLGLEALDVPIFAGTSLHLTGKEREACRALCNGHVELHNTDAINFLRSIAMLD